MYNISEHYIDDDETWNKCHLDDLWIFDKLILARRLGYVCGPHGVSVPQKNNYIIRPCVNLMSMGRGAFFKELSPSMNDEIPEGYFWCEIFKGRHLSIDYEDGEQILCVEGFRNTNNPIWKWDKWVRTTDKVKFPNILKNLKGKYKYSNIEMIDGKIIEIHLRLNSNWVEMDYYQTSEMIPIFEGMENIEYIDYTYTSSPSYLRKGFYFKN
tara:strand:- start:797 stop:1429 length:633 start_codon:yes stop_codon:yes gene_type:complete